MEERTQPGTLLDGRFVLLGTIGGGGAATVWRARDLETKTEVALKLIHPKFRRHDSGSMLVEKEALALYSLSHPSIARPLVVQLDRAQPYIVLEFVEGRTLAEELAERAESGRHFEMDELLEIAEELTDAVDHAHRRGVVHRDLKPPNVMLTEVRPGAGTRVKILDFGIAKLLLEAPHLATTEGRVQGSITYMSPEQSAGAVVDGRTDVFAIGCIVFEMLTLRRAWLLHEDGTRLLAYAESGTLDRQNNPVAIADRVAHAVRPSVTALRPDLPMAFDRWVERALSADPKQRHGSPRELWAELEAIARTDPAEKTLPHEVVVAAGAASTQVKTMLLPRTVAAEGRVPAWVRTGLVFGAGLALGAVAFAFFARPATPTTQAVLPSATQRVAPEIAGAGGVSSDPRAPASAALRGGSETARVDREAGSREPSTGDLQGAAGARGASNAAGEATDVREAANASREATDGRGTSNASREATDGRGTSNAVGEATDPRGAANGSRGTTGTGGVGSRGTTGTGATSNASRGTTGTSATSNASRGTTGTSATSNASRGTTGTSATSNATRETSPGARERDGRRSPPSDQRELPASANASAEREPTLATLLSRAKNAPDDPANIERLRDALLAAAARTEDAATRERVRRLVSTAAPMGDLDGLERALRELERAPRPH